MIEKMIESVTKIVPISWPLQSFIATNPLWDLHDQSFQNALQYMNQYMPIEGVMPISYYRDLYNNKKITEEDISEAAKSFLNNYETNNNLCSEKFRIQESKLVELLISEINKRIASS